ncbi:MAG: DJ/YajL/PfpI superfamily protein [Oscillospiraceae bacterium]|nr:DJ/YajL/PfpI superfamily protein [Oscillospiraceae bacterium]
MIYILLADGFEEIEALVPADLLRRAGLPVQLVGLDRPQVLGAHGISVNADLSLDQVELDKMELLVLPGGSGGVENIHLNLKAMTLIQQAYEKGRYLGAICAAPTLLAELGILDRRPATCFPGTEGDMGSAVLQKHAPVVVSGRIITGEAVGAVFPFSFALIEALEGETTMNRIKQSIVFHE